MIVHYCDRCGKLISNKKEISHFVTIREELCDTFKEVELCPHCIKELEFFLTHDGSYKLAERG